MRRVLAIGLLFVFVLPVVAPAVASALGSASSESSLPACCRRTGAHHCMLQSLTVSGSYRSVSSRCPYAPFARVILTLPHAIAVPADPAAALLFGPAVVIRQAEAGYRIAADRTRQKRGPPALVTL